jgi:hypothetical protein
MDPGNKCVARRQWMLPGDTDESQEGEMATPKRYCYFCQRSTDSSLDRSSPEDQMLYAALRRSIIESSGSNKNMKEVIVPAWLFEHILKSALATAPLDEDWYLDHNPDVRAAVEAGQIANAKQHFIERGYFEDRLPFAIEVDRTFYFETYPDVWAAHQRGDLNSAQDHFMETGYREGRQPSKDFSLFGRPA